MTKIRKLFVIACEASGDLHGAALIRELKKRNPEVSLQGLGGPRMKAEGMPLLYDMTKISALGLGDVVRLYFLYRDIFHESLETAISWRPDAVVVIDSPAFNLRFAKAIRKTLPKLPIFYYIAPQIWAWGGRRIHTVRKYITKIFSILPFETEFYKKAEIDCEFVGHPLVEGTRPVASRSVMKKELGIPLGVPAIGLLPGSRETEVKRILPIMVKAAEIMKSTYPSLVFYAGFSGNVSHAVYDKILRQTKLPIRRFSDRFNDYLGSFDFALVASGTATLQTALCGTPFFLLYKAGWSTYVLGRQLIKVPYLGLVNLLAGKSVVPEFIQRNAKPASIAHEACVLLKNQTLCEEMKKEFSEIRRMLGSLRASETTAESITQALKGPNIPSETPAQAAVRS